LLLLLLLLVLNLAALEGAVRGYYRLRFGRWSVVDPRSAAVNSRLYAPHAWLGRFPRPNSDVFTEGRHIRINTLGYRGPECAQARPPGVLRIVCIGGSTTFDVKVSDDDKTWPAQLQADLRRRTGLAGVEVVNAATNGYALPRTIIDLALRTLDLRPDWIICYPGVNDLAYADRTDHQFGESHRAIPNPPRAEALAGLLAYSELYNEIAARIRYARQLRYGNWEGRPVERKDEPDPRGIAAFERNLATLAGICWAHDVRLALVTVRVAYSPDQPIEIQKRLARGDLMDHPSLSLAGHYRGYALINEKIREAARRFDLPLIDQAAEMGHFSVQRSAISSGFESGATGRGDRAGRADSSGPCPPAAMNADHFADSVHFNDAGAAAFAAFTAERLAPYLLSATTMADSGRAN